MKIMPKIKLVFFRIRQVTRRMFRSARGKIKQIYFHYNVEALKETSVYALPHPVAWHKVYDSKKIWVEIGSGHGEVLRSVKGKDAAIIGFEWRSRFFRFCRDRIAAIPNALVYHGNGYEQIPLLFADGVIDRLFILFPDPWHKEKHHKRRPIVASWLKHIARKLAVNGEILIATDWAEYALFIEEQLGKISDVYEVEKGTYLPEKFDLPVTHYYQKWEKIGRKFRYFKLIKK